MAAHSAEPAARLVPLFLFLWPRPALLLILIYRLGGSSWDGANIIAVDDLNPFEPSVTRPIQAISEQLP